MFFSDEPETVPSFSSLVAQYVRKHVRAHATHPDKAAHEAEWMLDKYLAS